MGVVIFLFSWFGGWLDGKYPNGGGWYRKGFLLAGVFIALYYVIRQVQNLDKKQ